MNITKTDIFRGCLIASIMHAIMTNKYPELSYEQSWDETNYSIQNSSGLYCTITFDHEFCVGAIRNENDAFLGNSFNFKPQQYMNYFPLNVVQKANEETLQYLLVNNNGIVEPCVTSIFWADDTAINFDRTIDSTERDLLLIEDILLSEEEAIDRWTDYYEMDDNAIQLFNEIYLVKKRNFTTKVFLSKEQISLIPGSLINSECVESLKEINVFI